MRDAWSANFDVNRIAEMNRRDAGAASIANLYPMGEIEASGKDFGAGSGGGRGAAKGDGLARVHSSTGTKKAPRIIREALFIG